MDGIKKKESKMSAWFEKGWWKICSVELRFFAAFLFLRACVSVCVWLSV